MDKRNVILGLALASLVTAGSSVAKADKHEGEKAGAEKNNCNAKDHCNAKDGCEGKDSCKGKVKKAKKGEKNSCGGKDGCGAKEEKK